MNDCPPDYSQIPKTISDVADNLIGARRVGGLLRRFADGQRQRGEAFMDGSRILIQQCRPLMNLDDRDHVDAVYNDLRDARERLVSSDMSGFRRYREARKFKRLSKDTFETVKITSDRALDNNIVGPLDGPDPPAGAPPVPPQEPDRPSPNDLFTSSQSERIQDTKMTALPSGAADIGDLMDNLSESYSFIYPDRDFASSETSIASYKTERTVNSRKSRYNARPRHKYADCGPSYLRVPQNHMLSDVDDSETELMDESPSSPPGDQIVSLKPELVLESRPGPSPGAQPLDEHHAAQPATEHVHWDTQPPSPHQGDESPART